MDKPKALKFLSEELPKFFKIKFNELYEKKEQMSYCGIIYTPHVKNIFGIEEISLLWGNYTENDTTIFSGSIPSSYESDSKKWGEDKKENALKFRQNKILTMIATNSFGKVELTKAGSC